MPRSRARTHTRRRARSRARSYSRSRASRTSRSPRRRSRASRTSRSPRRHASPRAPVRGHALRGGDLMSYFTTTTTTVKPNWANIAAAVGTALAVGAVGAVGARYYRNRTTRTARLQRILDDFRKTNNVATVRTAMHNFAKGIQQHEYCALAKTLGAQAVYDIMYASGMNRAQLKLFDGACRRRMV